MARLNADAAPHTTGVVLELRRKDDGKPVWVQCWSRPAPDGSYTRTMFIDVTERVLMEREKARLEAQNTYLIEEIKEAHNFEEMVGQSQALAEVIEKVKLVASTDSSVLILGETGTGKELVARAVHSNSDRRNRPLVKVNCAALPVGLIESELFGHEKGAFTGATDRRIGRFELAHGGTIFLDEIGDMPPDLQAKLLRVLQEHEFERVGGSNLIKVDVRVIAATNRELLRSVSEGMFPAGPLLPSQRFSGSIAAAARTAGRYSAARALLRPPLQPENRAQDNSHPARNDGTADQLRLAGKCARARKRDRTIGNPVAGERT